jgi:salicylate hydroxylase
MGRSDKTEKSMRRRDLRILIAGGGIGGITTALALRQRGIDAQLFEQADAFREVGAGIQLSANATRVLRTLGLGEALAGVAVYPEGRDYRAWDTGERVFWTPLGERAEAHFGAPYYQVHRADLLDILVRALGDTSIHLNARV